MKLFAQVLGALAEGRQVAVATVVATSGSTPRHAGARMAVTDDGSTFGTIGGGRIELEVTEAAKQVAAGAPPRRVIHHLVRDLAMCCGGSMDVVVAPAAPSAPAMTAALAAGRERRPMLLDTPLDGGPVSAREVLREAARPWRAPRIAKRSEADGVGALPALPVGRGRSPLGIDGDVLREALGLGERVLLFGAGHVGRAIGVLAQRCDFDVVVCDDGDTGALDVAVPWAAAVVESFDLADAARALGGLGAGDLVLIVTRDHAMDQRILEQLLAGPDGVAVDELDFVGMIGSRGKVGRFRKRLEARGLLAGAGAARWAAVHAPVGLDLGAETPEEIAVAVVAQLVALRRRHQAEAGRWQRGDSGSVDEGG